MKKILFAVISLAVLVGGYLILGSIYKYELYELAMNAEKSRAGLIEKQVKINGINVSYLEGEKPEGKPTMLLIHGFAANKENWLRFAGNLADDYHLVAVDLLGHGKSTKDKSLRHDLDDQVAYLVNFLNAKGLTKVHLVGNSMGGAISSLFAAMHSDRVLSVSLVNPAGIFDHRSVLADYLDRGENPLVVKKLDDIYTLMDFAMEEKPFMPWPVPEVVAERSMANQDLNEQIFKHLKSTEHAYNFKEELGKIKAPVLIMWGEQDRVINYKNSDIFDQLIPNSRKLIYPDIGHVPMIEIPQRSSQDIHAFIEKNV
ncbi:alpha/beta fold hydrolase [Litoribrevibacter euphylliae]|uniref:Alpha/beta fold hydrolase n=1 Tax=Litoribrevibacter euphylliae TaxID=1834034 RepID=A0ABV7HFE3_9GAMM